ncbi:MAG: thioesterase [Alphaproteobacteria bacterium]|nr:MAG: thioesterase [Alphaproteobacteria bacterium]
MTTPHISSPMKVLPEWIDYNGHMNMAFYNVLFDRAADEFHALVGLGPRYAETRRHTTYTAEFHIRYLRELHLGQTVRVHSWILGRDEKRLHSWQEIHHEDGWIAATGETLTLHVDMSGPRVVPFPDDIARALDRFSEEHGLTELPEGAGRAIALRRR